MNTKIILADDHTLMRRGLMSLLSQQPDMDVIGEAKNGREALNLVRDLNPDIVVMDIAMPDLNGIEATRQIKAELPEVKIIALSMHADESFVVEMFKAGVSGYLLKDCAIEELTSAIHAVLMGKVYLSPEIAGIVVINVNLGSELQRFIRVQIKRFAVDLKVIQVIVRVISSTGQDTTCSIVGNGKYFTVVRVGVN